MGALNYLADRLDPRVQGALKITCSICKARPAQDCRHPWKGAPYPLGRIVHLCRAQAWMDK